MNEQEINIKIAEACGWNGMHKYPQEPTLIGESPIDGKVRRLPNYCNDLNAMALAEQSLESDPWDIYCNHLFDLDRSIVCIPAKQRAEAFIKVIESNP